MITNIKLEEKKLQLFYMTRNNNTIHVIGLKLHTHVIGLKLHTTFPGPPTFELSATPTLY